jgi:hypothetical protein
MLVFLPELGDTERLDPADVARLAERAMRAGYRDVAESLVCFVYTLLDDGGGLPSVPSSESPLLGHNRLSGMASGRRSRGQSCRSKRLGYGVGARRDRLCRSPATSFQVAGQPTHSAPDPGYCRTDCSEWSLLSGTRKDTTGNGIAVASDLRVQESRVLLAEWVSEREFERQQLATALRRLSDSYAVLRRAKVANPWWPEFSARVGI